jgi:hypothetical protein
MEEAIKARFPFEAFREDKYLTLEVL